MAILVRSKQSRRVTLRVLSALVLLAASGCLVLEQFGWSGPGLAFPHARHVGQEEMECIDCHADYEDGDLAGMPPLDDCLMCHGEGESDMPAVPVADLFEDGAFKSARINALPEEVKFSHLTHVTDEEGCLDCHGELVAGDAVRDWMAVSMDRCLQCHGERGVGQDCATCHSEVGLDSAPWTHDGNWEKHHGLSVRNRSDLTADRCSMCHEDSTCIACHQDEAPDNHTRYWRRRGHGLTAEMDRENCAACHGQDYCDRCHQEAVPLTHHGTWGGSRSSHCYGCHFEESDQSCFFCHDGTPSHAMAPPKPPGHNPASDCRSCHVILIHVDKGDNCNICHQ